jgi:hypothetical protein
VREKGEEQADEQKRKKKKEAGGEKYQLHGKNVFIDRNEFEREFADRLDVSINAW